MVARFEARTHEHISRVQTCLEAVADAFSCAAELQQRAISHDDRKWVDPERGPYIWLTEFHRCRRAGLDFAYPPGMEAQVQSAMEHHVTTNRHHPEFHANLGDMTEPDLIEMVCDWTAMAQEFGEDNGTARAWADKTVGKRLHFADEPRDLIYRVIDLLEQHLTRQCPT